MLSGVVSIEKNGQTVDQLREGDCFGEMGYLSDARRTATVTARTDVSLMRVNAATLQRAAEDTQLRFLKVFVQTLIKRLADTTAAADGAQPGIEEQRMPYLRQAAQQMTRFRASMDV